MARRVFSISYPTHGITVKYPQRSENKINTYGRSCRAGRKNIWLEVVTSGSTKLSFGWFGFKTASKSVLLERNLRVPEVDTLDSHVAAAGSRLIAGNLFT